MRWGKAAKIDKINAHDLKICVYLTKQTNGQPCGANKMKERLNLTIDGELLEAMKAYAASKEMSVSELVESYFRTVTKPVQRQNIVDLIDRLEMPPFDGRPGLKASFLEKAGQKELYYRGQEGKYGF